MRKTRLLTLLVLLIAAATGAWADKSETINTMTEGRTVYTGTHFKITASYNSDNDGLILFDNKNVIHGTATIESLTGENITKIEMHMSWGGTVATKTTTTEGKLEATDSNSNVNDISVININATSVEIGTAAGKGEGWVQIDKFVIYYEPYTYAVSLNDGGADTQNWTILPAEATTTGVAEGETVTLQYSGDRQVKSITATVVDPEAEETVTLATPLTVKVIEAGSIVVSFSGPTTNKCQGMKYSLDGGKTKTKITTTTTIDNLIKGTKVQFYGIGTSNTTYGDDPEVKITGGTATVKVYGNAMSLFDEENFATNNNTLPNAYFDLTELFMNNTKLTDASGLLLPATTLRGYCYISMFQGCSNLEAGPVLPAPTLVNSCYNYMFNGCSKLASITCLATSGIDVSNTSFWLQGAGSQATGDKIFTADPSATWPSGVSGIPSGWTRVNATSGE
jgi:hypothetical protein